MPRRLQRSSGEGASKRLSRGSPLIRAAFIVAKAKLRGSAPTVIAATLSSIPLFIARPTETATIIPHVLLYAAPLAIALLAAIRWGLPRLAYLVFEDADILLVYPSLGYKGALAYRLASLTPTITAYMAPWIAASASAVMPIASAILLGAALSTVYAVLLTCYPVSLSLLATRSKLLAVAYVATYAAPLAAAAHALATCGRLEAPPFTAAQGDPLSLTWLAAMTLASLLPPLVLEPEKPPLEPGARPRAKLEQRVKRRAYTVERLLRATSARLATIDIVASMLALIAIHGVDVLLGVDVASTPLYLAPLVIAVFIASRAHDEVLAVYGFLSWLLAVHPRGPRGLAMLASLRAALYDTALLGAALALYAAGYDTLAYTAAGLAASMITSLMVSAYTVVGTAAARASIEKGVMLVPPRRPQTPDWWIPPRMSTPQRLVYEAARGAAAGIAPAVSILPLYPVASLVAASVLVSLTAALTMLYERLSTH